MRIMISRNVQISNIYFRVKQVFETSGELSSSLKLHMRPLLIFHFACHFRWKYYHHHVLTTVKWREWRVNVFRRSREKIADINLFILCSFTTGAQVTVIWLKLLQVSSTLLLPVHQFKFQLMFIFFINWSFVNCLLILLIEITMALSELIRTVTFPYIACRRFVIFWSRMLWIDVNRWVTIGDNTATLFDAVLHANGPQRWNGIGFAYLT